MTFKLGLGLLQQGLPGFLVRFGFVLAGFGFLGVEFLSSPTHLGLR